MFDTLESFLWCFSPLILYSSIVSFGTLFILTVILKKYIYILTNITDFQIVNYIILRETNSY